jgi:hypothetical protein
MTTRPESRIDRIHLGNISWWRNCLVGRPWMLKTHIHCTCVPQIWPVQKNYMCLNETYCSLTSWFTLTHLIISLAKNDCATAYAVNCAVNRSIMHPWAACQRFSQLSLSPQAADISRHRRASFSWQSAHSTPQSEHRTQLTWVPLKREYKFQGLGLNARTIYTLEKRLGRWLTNTAASQNWSFSSSWSPCCSQAPSSRHVVW